MKIGVKRKKRKKKTETQKQWEKLYKENWRLCHDIVDLYLGHSCVVCGCADRLDLDHCFSRACRNLFFDIANLNYLCKAHHTQKSFQNGGYVDKLVDKITKEREGRYWWKIAMRKAQEPCRDWKTVGYMEQINIKLKERLAKELQWKDEQRHNSTTEKKTWKTD